MPLKRAARHLAPFAAFCCAFAITPTASARTVSPEQAKAWHLPVQTFTCPLGGQRFRQAVNYPHMVLASFPDGSHMGDEWIDAQIPECPDNGLLILPDYAAGDPNSDTLTYHDYTPAELARLPGLLESEAWRALAGQTRTLRAYWLATALERPVLDRYQLLLHAPWGAENTQQRQTALEWQVRDLGPLIDAVGKTPEDQTLGRYRLVNTLRELARFDEALTMLDQLDALPVDAAPDEDPDDELLRAVVSSGLRLAIADRDDDRNAIAMLASDMANRVCSVDQFAHYRGPNAARSCQAREEREAREEAELQAVFVLLEDRPSLDAQCAANDVDARDTVLGEACRRAQHGDDWAEGKRLSEAQPVETAAMCEAVPDHARSTVQVSACGTHEVYLGSAVGDLLDADDAAYDALCDVSTRLDHGALSQGCRSSADRRRDAQARALWADQAALRRLCRDKAALEDGFDGRHMACDALKRRDRDPYWLDNEQQSQEDQRSPHYTAALPYARALIARERAARATPSDGAVSAPLPTR